MSENLFPLPTKMLKDSSKLKQTKMLEKTRRHIGFICEVGFVKQKQNKKALRNATARKMFPLANFFYL